MTCNIQRIRDAVGKAKATTGDNSTASFIATVSPDVALALVERIEGLERALRAIASCQSVAPGDCIDIARQALAGAQAGKGGV